MSDTGHSAAAPPARRAALAFIFITVVIDAIGIGLMVPVLPSLYVELTGQGLAQAAVYGGILTALFGIAQFVATPLLGNLSDRYGRRPVLLISLLAFGINYVLTGLAPRIEWLFFLQVFAGVCGATYSTASAYIADVTRPEHRARAFGLIGACFGIGFIVGPVIGGTLAGFGTRVPFFVAAGLAFLNAAYGWFILPESLDAAHRRHFVWRRANPLGAFLQMRNYSYLLGLLGGLFLVQIAGMTLPATWPYYTMLKLGWNARDVGFSLAMYGVANIVVQGGLMGLATRRLGERRTIYLGLCFSLLGYCGFAFAASSALMLAFIVPTGIGFLAGPALTSIMTNEVPPNAQGELQGAIASMNSITAVFTPLLMTQVFSIFSASDAPVYFPGAPYLGAAALAALGLLTIVRALRRPRPAPPAGAA